MPNSVRFPLSVMRRIARIAILGGVALALGACSKCEVPDFFHIGGPHACHSEAPQP